MAQCIIESGHFSSPLAKRNKNILGMQCATLRPTTSGKGLGVYAKYKSWEDCLVDYAFWQSYHLSKIKSQDEYISLLSSVYCKDDDESKYRDLINKIVKTL